MTTRTPDFLPSLTAAVAWGAMFPIAATAMNHVDAFNLTAIRYGVAVVIFVVLLLAIEGRAALDFDGRFARILVLGALGFAGFNLLAYAGLETVPPQDAALIIALTPAITLLVRWALDGERPTGVQLAGTAAALVGVALVISRGRPADLFGEFRAGELLVLVGAVGWVFYTRGAREFATWSPLRYTTMTAIAGVLAIFAVTGAADAIGWKHVPSGADIDAVIPQLAYIVVFGAVVGVLAWNLGVRLLGAANATLFMNLVPVTAFAIEIARGYRPTAGEMTGAAITVGALVAVNLAGRRGAAAPVDGSAEEPVVNAMRESRGFAVTSSRATTTGDVTVAPTTGDVTGPLYP